MKAPQWASVSFGTIFCLECSGVHRSLGVHISFVRSVAMDSWTDQQLAIMKAGGNAACAKFLAEKGVPKNASIKQKYETPAAQLYKEVLKARVAGLPEPTSVPAPQPRSSTPYTSTTSSQYSSVTNNNNNNTTSNNTSKPAMVQPGTDPNGMERLAGESDNQYVARQTRIREEAKARMAAKFGGSGGMSGGRTMGGVGSNAQSQQSFGSNSGYDPSRGSYGGVDVDGLKHSFASGFGSVFSSVTSLTAQASQHVFSSSNSTKRAGTTTSVTDVWSSFTSAASRAAAAITEPDDGDGLAALQSRIREEKELRGGSDQATKNRYSGFGSEDAFNQGGFSSYKRGAAERNNNMSSYETASVTSSMATLGTMSSSSSIATNASSHSSISRAPSSLGSVVRPVDFSLNNSNNNNSRTTNSAPSSDQRVNVKKLPTDGDDFFASFGA